MSWVAMGLFSASTVINFSNTGALAEYGLGCIVLYVVPALVFLLPAAVVSAELGSTWKGGIFEWVHEAFGERWAFSAAWQQWMQNVLFCPLLLSFVAGDLAFLIDPELARNGTFNAAVVVLCFGGATLVSMRGIRRAARFATITAVVGIALPTLLLAVLAAVYLKSGHRSAVPLDRHHVVPPGHGFRGLVLVVGNFLAYGGVEVTAVHAREMRSPERGYPKSMALMAILAFVVFVTSSLGTAIAVVNHRIVLSASLMQAFDHYFRTFQVRWATPIMASLYILAALGTVVSWMSGPSHGMLAVGRRGLLPPFFQRTNRQGAPTGVLAVQAALVMLIAAAFVVVRNVNEVYWVLEAATTELYIVMYVIMFLAAIRLRKVRASTHRGFRAPLLPALAALGGVACAAGFVLGLLPPAALPIHHHARYVVLLTLVVGSLSSVPFYLLAFRKADWAPVVARTPVA
ncbi:putative glutamate/gamma-aminobutyrate antiporter [Labilithrix luteola]|uniref:Putative glutamate/gamma-aminobutyrate antiporter n=2 Tax=Labilithrix luteola TaxID=1391654 RepID=A0A0K1Q441_9BACT|nr:putative glutamate/gamma-aminobutyrate antiporter [Labilithrix luteola]